jgi:hypothetical protein
MPKTVLEKLGHKPGMTVAVIGCPANLLPLFLHSTLDGGLPDISLGFVQRASDLEPALETLLHGYRRGKALWLAYPKRGGGIDTDFTRDTGWEALEKRNLLPVTQIAIDNTWSALRFRLREEIPKLTRRF